MENKKVYQPYPYYDDGINMGWGELPEELQCDHFKCFESEEDCIEWLKDNGYNPEDFNIVEYDFDEVIEEFEEDYEFVY